jgi:hypothetical protein
MRRGGRLQVVTDVRVGDDAAILTRIHARRTAGATL